MKHNGRSVFAERLGQVLKYQQISQATLARELNVSRATVNNWCCGTSQPLLGRFEEIADVLGVRKSYLLGEEDSVPIPTDFKRLHHELLADGGVTHVETQQHLEELSNYLRYLRGRVRGKAP